MLGVYASGAIESIKSPSLARKQGISSLLNREVGFPMAYINACRRGHVLSGAATAHATQLRSKSRSPARAAAGAGALVPCSKARRSADHFLPHLPGLWGSPCKRTRSVWALGDAHRRSKAIQTRPLFPQCCQRRPPAQEHSMEKTLRYCSQFLNGS